MSRVTRFKRLMKSPNVSTDQKVHTSTTRRRYYDAGKSTPSKTYTRTMDGGTGFYRNTEPGSNPQGPQHSAPSDAFGKFLGTAAQVAGAASSIGGAFPTRTPGKPVVSKAPTTTAVPTAPLAKKGLNVKNKDMKKAVVNKGKSEPSGKSVKMVKTYEGGSGEVKPAKNLKEDNKRKKEELKEGETIKSTTNSKSKLKLRKS